MTTPNDRRLYRRLLLSGFALALPACKEERPPGFGESCCSEQEWPTSAETAKAYASQGATETLGCPARVEPSDAGADAGTPPPYAIDLHVPATQRERADGGGVCVYKRVSCCPGGRPLLAQGFATVASRARGTAWSGKTLRPLGESLPERAAIARAWLDDALAEHASVASFARATLELMAAGAPPDLLAAHQRAALDEIHHAELCFALAAAYGAEPIEPGPLAVPGPRSGDLARNVFVEGCVAETIGALLASRALEDCTVPEVGDALRIIAEDEAEHASLAWRTLAWILRTDPRAAKGVFEHCELSFDSSVDSPAHGRLGKEEILRATHDAWRFVIEPQLCHGAG